MSLFFNKFPILLYMKLLVCGSRSIKDFEWVGTQIENYILSTLNLTFDDITIIEGEASGVDTIAKMWAEFRMRPIISMPADWKTYGRGAGIIRNKQMVELCDACLILWDGVSKGTKNDITLCEKLNKPIKVILYKKVDNYDNNK